MLDSEEFQVLLLKAPKLMYCNLIFSNDDVKGQLISHFEKQILLQQN